MINPSRSVKVQGFLAALRTDEPASEGPCNCGQEQRPVQQQVPEATPYPVRVLVAVDQSDPGKWAVRVGERLARAVRGEVVLLHVINQLSSSLPEMSMTWEIER